MNVADTLYALMDAFPRDPMSADNLATYRSHLADLPLDKLEEAVVTLIRTSDRLPSIKAIREQTASLMLDLPDESEALLQVERRIEWSRSGDATEIAGGPPVHELVRKALDHVGGFHAFRTTEEPAVLRGQFLRLYRESRATAIRGVQTGAALTAGALALPRRAS